MKLDNLNTIKQMESFIVGSQAIAFEVAANKRERYHLTEKILRRFNYSGLKCRDKGILIQFLCKITNYSRQQMTRMIKRYIDAGELLPQQKTTNGFERCYVEKDIKQLAELDKRHDTPNGFIVKKLCERAYEKFNDRSYERLANISVSHIYNRDHEEFQRALNHWVMVYGHFFYVDAPGW